MEQALAHVELEERGLRAPAHAGEVGIFPPAERAVVSFLRLTLGAACFFVLPLHL